ncbi:hypothetical protein BH23VER1_BH23VER1_34280 [soil metagenome]
MNPRTTVPILPILLALSLPALAAPAADKPELPLPPALPGGAEHLEVAGGSLLQRPDGFDPNVAIASAPPEVTFRFYPGQDHPGSPWSHWGDGSVSGGIYYSAIGDHQKPKGTALVYAYDPADKALRTLVDIRKFLEESDALAEDENYTSGKVHTRIEMGSDGWLYYAGHRGSTQTTDDAHGFRGERVFRTDPEGGTTEIVSAFPIAKHIIPTGMLDAERMLYYGGTAAGDDAPDQGVWLFVLDLKSGEILLRAKDGPKRCALLSRTTGNLYWDGRRYDPNTNTISDAPGVPPIRSASAETADGTIYFTSDKSSEIFAFDVEDESVRPLGDAGVGQATYTTSLDIDPTGRYLYLVPGAHGQAAKDGTPVVQFDTESGRSKVLCFLVEPLREAAGYTPTGTFSSALSEDGGTLFVTWNGYRDDAPTEWDVCALTEIRIPESERQP